MRIDTSVDSAREIFEETYAATDLAELDVDRPDSYLANAAFERGAFSGRF